MFSMGGASFMIQMNPGLYPTTVDTDPVARTCQVAEHKVKQSGFEMYLSIIFYN